MNIEVNNLILEVTRRCNMHCAHCLRGNAQSIDMPPNLIKNVLKTIEGALSVTFTGGEPSLNVPAIERFFEEANKANKLPLYFYVVTNGLENQVKLASTLLKWYPYMEDKECCGIAMSKDKYHDIVEAPNFAEGLAFYRNDKEHDVRASASDDWVLSEGRAVENGIGYRKNLDTDIEFEYEEDNDTVYVDTLYVSVKGTVLGNCDCSYETIDDEGIPLTQLQAYFERRVKRADELRWALA